MTTESVTSIINNRRLIEGPTDMLRSVSQRRYAWTAEVTKAQEDNRWFPGQVPLVTDAAYFPRLDRGCQIAYKRALAFLSNLDAIQCDNLTENLYPHVTDPHVQQCLATQIAEEWIHVESYSRIIETVVKGDDLGIYLMYKDVPQLAAKNQHVIAVGQRINQASDEPFGAKFIKAIVANIALEGIYFFSGFTTFFALGRQSGGGLTGSTDMIKYIQRDELDHLFIFINMWLVMRQERPELFTRALLDECIAILQDAVAREKSWGHYVIEEGVPLLDNKRMDGYIDYRGYSCVQAMRLDELGVANPFPSRMHDLAWVNDYLPNKGHKNFFEGKPVNYTHNSLVFQHQSGPRAIKPLVIPRVQ